VRIPDTIVANIIAAARIGATDENGLTIRRVHDVVSYRVIVGRSVQVNAGLMIRIYQVADDQGILRIRVKLYAAIRAVVDLVLRSVTPDDLPR
jgi:hypothetical protein